MKMAHNKSIIFVICAVAVLAIISSFASFSGLAVYNLPIAFDIDESYKQTDFFGAKIIINTQEILSTDSLVIYIDSTPIGVVPLKNYLDANKIPYSLDKKGGLEFLNTKRKFKIPLKEYISLDQLSSGTHILRVQFSETTAASETKFRKV